MHELRAPIHHRSTGQLQTLFEVTLLLFLLRQHLLQLLFLLEFALGLCSQFLLKTIHEIDIFLHTRSEFFLQTINNVDEKGATLQAFASLFPFRFFFGRDGVGGVGVGGVGHFFFRVRIFRLFQLVQVGIQFLGPGFLLLHQHETFVFAQGSCVHFCLRVLIRAHTDSVFE